VGFCSDCGDGCRSGQTFGKPKGLAVIALALTKIPKVILIVVASVERHR
jgi:hypothetical protein